MKRAWHQNFKRATIERRTARDGIVFHTIGEMNRWEKLKLWQLAGEIRNLRRQVGYALENREKDIQVLTPTGKIAHYTADFVYERKTPQTDAQGTRVLWPQIIEDFKGYNGKEARLRIAIFEALYKVKVHISR